MYVLKGGKGHHILLINILRLMALVHFAEGTSKSIVNYNFYIGSVTAFYRLWKYKFSQGISMCCNAAKMHHGMLVNLMGFC